MTYTNSIYIPNINLSYMYLLKMGARVAQWVRSYNTEVCMLSHFHLGVWLWCWMPLSTIFQLLHGGSQFYWCRKTILFGIFCYFGTFSFIFYHCLLQSEAWCIIGGGGCFNTPLFSEIENNGFRFMSWFHNGIYTQYIHTKYLP
jgi:hypothetical protein